jgi:microcystin-dependent protein
MSSPFIGEIRMFGGNFAPVGWAFCDGSLIPISENDALFNLIGTTYGGDGQNTFALPDLRSRIPVHVGPGFALGQSGGVESVTLTTSQIPAHSHVPQSFSTGGNQNTPAAGVWALSSAGSAYASNTAPTLAMDPGAIGTTGGSQPHDNMVPFLAVNFILSLFGIFPSQT